MSDERDETRQSSPFDDATQVGGTPVSEDAPGAAADETRVMPAAPSDPTVVTPRTGGMPPRSARVDATTALPPVDDWAASRGNPAWAGRAEVRAPLPAGTEYQDEDWPARPMREPRDRWWMPIVIGIVTLVLLGALGWGLYLIVQNSGTDGTPAPATTSAAAPQPAVTTRTAAPTTEPTTTAPPTTTPATTPTTDSTAAIKIPALKGRSLSEAQSALSSVGLGYRLIYHAVSDAAPDTVIDSDPFEGQEVPPDTRVTLVIAARPQSTPPSTPPSTAVVGQPEAGDDD
jgi:PASTA domain-containing protein